MSKYIFIGLKKTCLGSFRIEKIRDNDNKTGLKEGGGIEMSYKCQLQVLSIYAMHALSSLLYLLTAFVISVQFKQPCEHSQNVITI